MHSERMTQVVQPRLIACAVVATDTSMSAQPLERTFNVNRGGLVIEIDLNLTANRVNILPKRLAIWPGYPLGVS